MIRRRRGFALVAAIIIVVLLAALIVGAFIATTEETRISGGVALGERGIEAAETAVERDIAGWGSSQCDSVAIGGRLSRMTSVDGIPVTTTLIRLDSTRYWLIGDAGAGGDLAGRGPLVHRRIGVWVRRVADSAGRGFLFRFEQRAWSELF